MKFGICAAPHALGAPEKSLQLLADAGADYVEWAVGAVMASDETFNALQQAVDSAPIRPEAFNAFLPPHHRLTGPSVDLQTTLDYAGEAMNRCAALGAEIIVLGSGGARKVPEGFPMDEALAQFTAFCRELAPRAASAGVTVVIEPLNSEEDNLINSVAAGARVVEEVSHPHLQLLADFYHMFKDGEPMQNIVDAENKIRHTHLADLGRVAPGYAREGEADFIGFFGALKQIGYDARCSFEGKTDDLIAQARPLLKHMKQRATQS